VFPCEKCGSCCRHVGQTPLGRQLAKPNGVCRHFNEENKLCMIYKNRPIICNVDAFYQNYLQKEMDIDDFYALNKKVCAKLQRLYQIKSL